MRRFAPNSCTTWNDSGTDFATTVANLPASCCKSWSGWLKNINWTSFALTADAANFFYKYWFDAPPWEAPQRYWERSPLSRLQCPSTGMLVFRRMPSSGSISRARLRSMINSSSLRVSSTKKQAMPMRRA